MMRTTAWLLIIGVAYLLPAGCTPKTFEDSLPTTLEEATRIAGNASLSVQTRREQLEELGLRPLVINALLLSERTGNQFGGDLRSAYDKIAGGQFSLLTPDEVQIYNDASVADDNGVDFELNDGQAQLIVDLFVEQEIDTADELSAYLTNPATELPAGITAEQLTELFIDFDPQNVVDQLP